MPPDPPRRRAGVAGSPIGHSLSPVLHTTAYAALGLDWDYRRIECAPGGLAALLAEVRFDAAWAGLSLTMPLKLPAVALLDQLLEPAGALGAVNTVLRRPGGLLVGLNTDVGGVLASLDELRCPRPARVVVLGAGGAARAVLAALAERAVEEVTVLARDPARAGSLAEFAAGRGVRVRLVAWPALGELTERCAAAPLVVSTVPAGVTDALAARAWPATTALLDVLYDPWPPPLVRAARRAGAPAIGGLAMLVEQAALAVQAMTGGAAPRARMRLAGERALVERTREGRG